MGAAQMGEAQSGAAQLGEALHGGGASIREEQGEHAALWSNLEAVGAGTDCNRSPFILRLSRGSVPLPLVAVSPLCSEMCVQEQKCVSKKRRGVESLQLKTELSVTAHPSLLLHTGTKRVQRRHRSTVFRDDTNEGAPASGWGQPGGARAGL